MDKELDKKLENVLTLSVIVFFANLSERITNNTAQQSTGNRLINEILQSEINDCYQATRNQKKVVRSVADKFPLRIFYRLGARLQKLFK